MDIKNKLEALPNLIKKYRYPLVIILVGLVLLAIPGRSAVKSTASNPSAPVQQNKDAAIELSEILGAISGVGKVKVMLTESAGERTQYHYDEDISSTDGSSSVRKETIIISSSDRSEEALISQVTPPVYKGAIVVCQGADQPSVKLAVVEAVSKATGLGADQISVLKMK